MKTLFLLVSILFSFTASAELKPPGAIIPEECGYNKLEAPGYPVYVCINYVQEDDHTDLPFRVISLDYGQGKKKYYVVESASQESSGKVVYNAYSASVEKENGYIIFKGTAAPGERLLFIKNDNNFYGVEINVTLEPIYTTESL